jgi:ribosomal protein S18 acetylase RimI-like enzyme
MIAQPLTLTHLPTPPARPGYTWRPAQRADAPVIHQLRLAVDEADHSGGAGTLQDTERLFEDSWVNPETDTLLALTPEGQAAALVCVFLNPQPVEEARAFIWDDVHPAHRGRGLEAFALEWGEARGRQRLRAAPGPLPRVLRTGSPDHLPQRLALVESRGFRPIRYFYRMRRDLSQPIPDHRLPEGLTLRTYGPELSEALREAFNESFADHWSFEPVTEEDWRIFFVERETFRPDLTFVVMDGGEIAAHSLNRVDPEENARQGLKEGWVGQLGTRRAWRKRGIATALLCASMRAFKAEGLDYATLGVDAENLTGALAIYERLGFVVVKRFIAFAKAAE